MLKNLSLICLLVNMVLVNGYVNAQTDSVFWFGAPEVISDHGDRPIRIFCTSTTKDVNVTLSQPANPNFTPISFALAKGESHNIDLTPWIASIETSPNNISNSGLLLKADGLITAYYEVVPYYNPDIFSLKGDNALGTEFWIPGQNHYFNGPYGGVPRSGFIIVATEDNTLVTIIPKNDLVGHPKGIPFDIVLNRGQCYATRSVSAAAGTHVGGDYIKSNKRIAITLKDDSLGLGIGCWDLGGDQIIPARIIGNEYIVTQGALAPEDRYFITATVDQTKIYINGNTVPDLILDEGEIGNFSLGASSALIYADHPIYVLHVTGWGCELGFGIIPPYKCTGSSSVHFSRSTPNQFRLFVFTQTKNISDFAVDGNPNILTANNFVAVPGSNNKFSSAYIDLSSFVGVGIPVNVTNSSGLFHLGLINGQNGVSSRYGYFSNFGSPFKSNFTTTSCSEESLILESKYSTGNEWYINDSLVGVDSIYEISTNHSVEIILISETSFSCLDTTLFSIDIIPESSESIYHEMCYGDSVMFGNKKIKEGGQYYDTLTGVNGCDSILILDLNIHPLDTNYIVQYSCSSRDTGWTEQYFNNTASCDSIVFTHTQLLPSYLDSFYHFICPSDSIFINDKWINKTGQYVVDFKSIEGCDSTEIHILNHYRTDFTTQRLEICAGEYIDGIRLFNDTNMIRNHVNIHGCDSTDLLMVTVNPLSIKNEIEFICEGMKYRNIVMQNDSVFIDTLRSLMSCDTILSTYITILPLPDIKIEGSPILCEGTESEIFAFGGSEYKWSTGSEQNKIQITNSGHYSVIGKDANGCINFDSIIIVTPELHLSYLSSPPICPDIDDGEIMILDYDNNYRYFINGEQVDSSTNGLPPNEYEITIIDSFGCSKRDTISFEDPPELIISLVDTIYDFIGNIVTVAPKINMNPAISRWHPNDYLTCDTCFVTYAEVQKGYQYYIRVMDERGCITIDSVYIKGLKRNLYVPNVFSPNGDHLNDKFTLYSNDGYTIIEKLKIYSRWGELLYEENNLPFNDPNYGWNGNHNGNPMNPGVYAYVATVLRTDGKSEVLFGDVTLAK